ncbi:hypothetical protein [Sporosarcina globispora]|nr:hypothetical protein [Sporosarcina globispora]
MLFEELEEEVVIALKIQGSRDKWQLTRQISDEIASSEEKMVVNRVD